jgi:chromosome segregation ATPase
MAAMVTKRKGPVKAVEFPETTRTMPASQGMLRLVRDELAHRIDAAEERSAARDAEIRAEVAELRGKVGALDAKVDALDKKFEAKINALDEKIDAKFDTLSHEMHAGFQVMQSMMARCLALNEEQARQNSIVLEAVVGVRQRQDRQEKSHEELWTFVHDPGRANKKS